MAHSSNLPALSMRSGVRWLSSVVGVFGLAAKEIEALPEPEVAKPRAGPASAATRQPEPRYEQQIHFCTTGDGVQIAYSQIGSGPPVVKTGNWMTHLEFDFESPIWRHLYRELSRDHQLTCGHFCYQVLREHRL
jgi:hypothetical protein